jgi:hypothetical protein
MRLHILGTDMHRQQNEVRVWFDQFPKLVVVFRLGIVQNDKGKRIVIVIVHPFSPQDIL